MFDWSQPIGLGLFIVMCGMTLVLLGVATWVVSHSAIPGPTRRGRR